jgi:hypothetical protein
VVAGCSASSGSQAIFYLLKNLTLPSVAPSPLVPKLEFGNALYETPFRARAASSPPISHHLDKASIPS